MSDTGSRRRKTAAALAYDAEKDAAPRLVAAGKGLIAENIVARARAAGIPMMEDHALAATLVKLPIGTAIPAELYQAVAEVLAFIYRLDGRLGSKGS